MDEEEKKEADDTGEENEKDSFEDFDEEFGKDEEEEDGKDDDEKKDADKKDGKPKDSRSSAIFQKQKYREKYRATLKELEAERAKHSSAPPATTEEEKKERAAEEYLLKKIEEVLDKHQTRQQTVEQQQLEEFQEQLDETLEEYSDLSEEELLAVCEEFDVSPVAGAKILRKQMELGGKPKPKMPRPKRGTPEVLERDKREDAQTPRTFNDVARSIKERLQRNAL